MARTGSRKAGGGALAPVLVPVLRYWFCSSCNTSCAECSILLQNALLSSGQLSVAIQEDVNFEAIVTLTEKMA